MIIEHSATISAAPDVVWAVFTDVERWPTWTPSVTRVEPLDGAGLEPGRRFRITQPRLPVLVWQVSELSPGRSWTWQTRSLGARTSAVHELRPDGAGGTVVTQRLDQRGWLGRPVAALLRGLSRRYLQLEADGLKRASEEKAQVAP